MSFGQSLAPCSFVELLERANRNDWTTLESIENAVDAFKDLRGVDLSKESFRLMQLDLEELLENLGGYQSLYKSISDVGRYQIEGGKAQSVADDRMDWFGNMVKNADNLFPSLGVVDQNKNKLYLVDGIHRASARYVAGHPQVWAYIAILKKEN